MDELNETGADQPSQVETDSPSLKEKIGKINFMKWGKRAAITAGVALVAAVALSVANHKPAIEE